MVLVQRNGWPLLANNGWQYRCTNIWDKGIGHIAGNVNSKTIRQFPIVTEVCVQYVRKVELLTRVVVDARLVAPRVASHRTASQ